MHHRLLPWLVVGAFAAISALRAQAPESSGVPPAGLVLVAQVRGTATKTLNGQVMALQVNDAVEQTAKINTGRESSVVLVFSNGATTQLGDETELVIDEFLQDPFGSTLKLADLEEEPSRSNTRLSLNRGELVGKVARLRHDRGSTFIVQTPVGAAGIRGTTFRIVFRPQGTGLAFFQLSTVEGNVNFSQGAPAPGGPAAGAVPGGLGQPQPPGQEQGQTPAQPGTPAAGTGPPAGVPVVGGQEVVIQVSVTVTPAGQFIVTTPQIVAATIPISAAVQTQIIAQAQNIAVAVAATTFTPPPPPPPPASTTGPAPAAGTTETPPQTPVGTTGTTGTTGSTGRSESAGAATAGTGPTPPGGTTPASPAQTPSFAASNPPPPTTPPPKLTPGDGRPGG
jgi:hypothetical protein